MAGLRWADICDEEGDGALDPWECLRTDRSQQEEAACDAKEQRTQAEKDFGNASGPAASCTSHQKEQENVREEDDSPWNRSAGSAEPQMAHSTFWQPLTDNFDLALRVEAWPKGMSGRSWDPGMLSYYPAQYIPPVR